MEEDELFSSVHNILWTKPNITSYSTTDLQNLSFFIEFAITGQGGVMFLYVDAKDQSDLTSLITLLKFLCYGSSCASCGLMHVRLNAAAVIVSANTGVYADDVVVSVG